MNQHAWAYEICSQGIAPLDKSRKVETVVLTKWIFDQLWDTILKKGIETSVELKISSDTYKLEAKLRYNQKEVATQLDLLV